jgi:ADP-dependent phosphofructokinase/glucokinase
MGDKIAMGFHSAIDYELKWNVDVITALAVRYKIYNNELNMNIPIHSERDLILSALAHIRAGVGGEFIPETNDICKQFADHFQYTQTVGGTATRAAIAISKVGYESALSMCCSNQNILKSLPPEVHYFLNVTNGSQEVYPHVILSYPAKEHIHANDIEIITSRANRLMYSNDTDAKNMIVSTEFASRLRDVKAFLLGCFSEVVDFDILKARMFSTKELLRSLNDDSWVMLEDGCYIEKDFRYYVHNSLKEYLDILSMNEDEMQDYAGKRINMFNPETVAETIDHIHEEINIPLIVVHSAHWTIAYGEHPNRVKDAVNSGICMSSSRFIYGDSFGKDEYKKTAGLPTETEAMKFCNEIKSKFGDRVCCLPAKNLDFVKRPTIVGLGDFFAGGMISGLSAVDKKLSRI